MTFVFVCLYLLVLVPPDIMHCMVQGTAVINNVTEMTDFDCTPHAAIVAHYTNLPVTDILVG